MRGDTFKRKLRTVLIAIYIDWLGKNENNNNKVRLLKKLYSLLFSFHIGIVLVVQSRIRPVWSYSVECISGGICTLLV